MRKPSFEIDGWELGDGEERNLEAPDTFHIPSLEEREGLRPGDFAQLIFRIAVTDETDQDSEAVERMWVIVRGRVGFGYLGVLNNEPSSIWENETFWAGSELPFEAKHVITVRPGNKASKAIAAAPPRTPWPPPRLN